MCSAPLPWACASGFQPSTRLSPVTNKLAPAAAAVLTKWRSLSSTGSATSDTFSAKAQMLSHSAVACDAVGNSGRSTSCTSVRTRSLLSRPPRSVHCTTNSAHKPAKWWRTANRCNPKKPSRTGPAAIQETAFRMSSSVSHPAARARGANCIWLWRRASRRL